MLRIALWLLVAIITVWAHRARANLAPRTIVRLASLLGIALAIWRGLDLAAATRLIHLEPLPWFAIKAFLGLVVWTGIVGLIGHSRRKRDLAVRAPLLGLTTILGMARSPGVAVPTLPAIADYRWMRALPT